jgi:hypothetical protein
MARSRDYKEVHMKKAFVLIASLAIISLVLAGCTSGGNGGNGV